MTAEFLDGRSHRQRTVEELGGLLERLVGADTLADRLDALVRVVRWTRGGFELIDRSSGSGQRPALELDRATALLDLLDGSPDIRARFQAAVAAILAETDATALFADAGIPGERGFVAELGERIMSGLLPAPREDRDLAHLLRRLYRTTAEVESFHSLQAPTFARLAALLVGDEHAESWSTVRRSFNDAFRLLAARVQAQGLQARLRERSPAVAVTESPFYRLARASEAVLAAGAVPDGVGPAAEAWRREAAACRATMAEIHRRLEQEGVSVDIVFGLEVLERSLARMAAMVDVMTAPGAVERAAALHDLLARLVASTHDDRSVTHLIGWNLNLLFRRIVERSGETGEHYIAATRAEYRHIWLAAAGGGLLTGGTAAIKATLSTLHAPDFVHGVLYGLNYAISFLLLHRWGLVLATKQPAMTAATLATIIRERRGGDRVDEIIEFTARICRSQLAAAIGNVAVVAATAFSIDGLWRLVVGRPYMEAAEATATYQAMSPLNSGTLFYAALTGVILYLAAIAGGWFDNFCAYHRLPDAVAQHPLRRTLGRARLARWGASLDRNAAAWATNVALGFMLGMTPAIGHFLGLPLDVRHVTLNTGILALASASLGDRWFLEGFFLTGLAGIAVMFVLNLSVSFLLSLGNAARAYDVPNAEVWDLLRRLYRRFVTAPRDFILPPRRDPAAPAPPHQA